MCSTRPITYAWGLNANPSCSNVRRIVLLRTSSSTPMLCSRSSAQWPEQWGGRAEAELRHLGHAHHQRDRTPQGPLSPHGVRDTSVRRAATTRRRSALRKTCSSVRTEFIPTARARSNTAAPSPSATTCRSRSCAQRNLSCVFLEAVNWILSRSDASGATTARATAGTVTGAAASAAGEFPACRSSTDPGCSHGAWVCTTRAAGSFRTVLRTCGTGFRRAMNSSTSGVLRCRAASSRASPLSSVMCGAIFARSSSRSSHPRVARIRSRNRFEPSRVGSGAAMNGVPPFATAAGALTLTRLRAHVLRLRPARRHDPAIRPWARHAPGGPPQRSVERRRRLASHYACRGPGVRTRATAPSRFSESLQRIAFLTCPGGNSGPGRSCGCRCSRCGSIPKA